MRCILVDDEPLALDVLEIQLNEIGNITIVGSFTNPYLALEVLETTQVDAVFLDIQMPGIVGLEFARITKQNYPHIQIVFTTAYSEFAVDAFEINSVDYLLKPFTKERLEESVRRIEKNRSLLNNNAEKKYRVQCLGGFMINNSQDRSQVIHWKTNKKKELCAFLIHQLDKPVETDQIIEALWPEYDIEKAKSYLYTCLSYLRKTLMSIGLKDNLKKSGKGYLFLTEGLMVDVKEFVKVIEEIPRYDSQIEEQYKRMVALYTGGYLERCDYRWAIAKREDILKKYIHILRYCYGRFIQNGHVALAVDSLQNILLLVPESEQDAQDLMKIYVQIGKKVEAVKVYRQLEATLQKELGVQMTEQTKYLFQTIAGHEEV